MRVIVTCQIVIAWEHGRTISFWLMLGIWCGERCFSVKLFWIRLIIWFPRYPGTGEYDKFFDEGIYKCAGCGTPLYKSSTKFNSGCGWPAFYEGFPGAIRQTVCTILTPDIIALWPSSLQSPVINQSCSSTLAGPRWQADRDHMCCLWRTFGAYIQRGRV